MDINQKFYVVVHKRTIQEAIIPITANTKEEALAKIEKMCYNNHTSIKYEPFTTKFKVVQVHDFEEYELTGESDDNK